MLAQPGRHRRAVAKECREDASIRGDDRVVVVEDVEGGRAVVRVDDDLDAVPHVVGRLAAEQVVPRVRIGARCRVGVQHPEDPAIVRDDDVRVGVEGEKRRERPDPFADVAAHQEPAVRRDVVAERQLGDIAAVEGDQQPAQESTEPDAAFAFVRRQIVGLALRVVELLLPRLDVHVRVRELAEVDLGPRHVEARNRALNRHVAQDRASADPPAVKPFTGFMVTP